MPLDLGRLTNLIGHRAVDRRAVELYRRVGITTVLAKLDGTRDANLATLERLVELASSPG